MTPLNILEKYMIAYASACTTVDCDAAQFLLHFNFYVCLYVIMQKHVHMKYTIIIVH